MAAALFNKPLSANIRLGWESVTPAKPALNREHQVDNNGYNEFVLLEFSKPIDPASVKLTSTTGGDMDVSYWLGGNAVQKANLAGKSVAALASSLGFGPINNSDGTASGTRTVDLTGGAPAGYVNAILFGPRYGQNDANYDYFKVTSITGSTGFAVRTILGDPALYRRSPGL